MRTTLHADPVHERLRGIDEGRVQEEKGRDGPADAFAQARATMSAFFEWAPSTRATLRIVDAIGGHARAFLSQVPAPDDDGEVLVVQVDGGGAPAISSREPKRRRSASARAFSTKS